MGGVARRCRARAGDRGVLPRLRFPGAVVREMRDCAAACGAQSGVGGENGVPVAPALRRGRERRTTERTVKGVVVRCKNGARRSSQ